MGDHPVCFLCETVEAQRHVCSSCAARARQALPHLKRAVSRRQTQREQGLAQVLADADVDALAVLGLVIAGEPATLSDEQFAAEMIDAYRRHREEV